MNIQERDQLNTFLQQLVQVRAEQKDTEAEALIREACVRQSDANYLLVQRAMQLQHALESAKAECAQLQLELNRTRSNSESSFLSDPNAWGSRGAAAPAASTASPAAASALPAQPGAPGPLAVPAASAPSAWGSGMLGTVATTAAGVVAGSFLYHGVSNLMGHRDHGGMSGQNKAADAAPAAPAQKLADSDHENSGTDEKFGSTDLGHDLGVEDVA